MLFFRHTHNPFTYSKLKTYKTADSIQKKSEYCFFFTNVLDNPKRIYNFATVKELQSITRVF